jgi:hypothetical protein
VDQNSKVKLELTGAEVQTVINGLGELPAKLSFALMQKILGAVGEQYPQPPPAPPAPTA